MAYTCMVASTSIRYAIGAALVISPAAISAAKPVSKPATITFKVGNRTLTGEPSTVCSIKGTWRDGTPFRYDGWDTCQKLYVRAASLAEYKDWKPRGRKGALTVADIPPGTEVIEIGNDFSSILVFRDRHGDTLEVLIRD